MRMHVSICCCSLLTLAHRVTTSLADRHRSDAAVRRAADCHSVPFDWLTRRSGSCSRPHIHTCTPIPRHRASGCMSERERRADSSGSESHVDPPWMRRVSETRERGGRKVEQRAEERGRGRKGGAETNAIDSDMMEWAATTDHWHTRVQTTNSRQRLSLTAPQATANDNSSWLRAQSTRAAWFIQS